MSPEPDDVLARLTLEQVMAELARLEHVLREAGFEEEAAILGHHRAAWLMRGERGTWAKEVERVNSNADPESCEAFDAMIREPGQPPARQRGFVEEAMLGWVKDGGSIDDGLRILAEVFVNVCGYEPQVVEDGLTDAVRRVSA